MKSRKRVYYIKILCVFNLFTHIFQQQIPYSNDSLEYPIQLIILIFKIGKE